MKSRLQSIADYVLWLMQQYQDIKQAQSAATYRIVDIKKGDTEDSVLTVQLCGKNTVFKLLPKEILTDNALLEGFSKRDIRTITYLACSNEKPKAKIVLQEFCDHLNSVVFGIKRPGNQEILKKSAAEISLDKKLIAELTPEEALMVGYMLADENFSKEKNSGDST